VKTFLDGTLIGLGLAITSWYPRLGQLGILFILIGLCVIAYLIWNNRP